jgi:ubiquinone/menaquinone biosynthesis C-methylase UbiE
MNKLHLVYCASPEWAEVARDHIIPWATRGANLGEHLLEVGPGPGMTTDILRTLSPKLTAIELDPDLAAALEARTAGGNVTVVQGDATAMPFEDGQFTSAICLTMLHHVPTPEDQDRLFAEMARVVRRGGVILGSDNLDSPEFRTFHEDDRCTPIDPATLRPRLERAGLRGIIIETNPYAVRFMATVG